MVTLKDTNLPLPTKADEVSYSAFEAYRENNLVQFFKIQTGANPDLYPDLIIPYAASCSGVIKHCIEMGETPRSEVELNGRVITLPEDLGDAPARKFWAHSLAKDDIEGLCAYIDATPEEIKAAPYYVVRQLLLFFSALQNACERFLNLSRQFHPMKTKPQPDLSNYQIDKDGVQFSPKWLAVNSNSKHN